MRLLVAAAFALLVLRDRGRTTPRRPADPDMKLVLLLLVIELRSGLSVLAALGKVAATLPDYESLTRVHRLARVSGLTAALAIADDRLRPVVSQLIRSQKSGSSLTVVAHRMIETELQSERARRVARARTLPVKLMIPVTLLMLPGLVLMLYAPSLLAMFEDLTGGLT